EGPVAGDEAGEFPNAAQGAVQGDAVDAEALRILANAGKGRGAALAVPLGLHVGAQDAEVCILRCGAGDSAGDHEVSLSLRNWGLRWMRGLIRSPMRT